MHNTNLVEKSEERRPSGRSKRRWEDNIKMVLQEVGWGSMDMRYLAQEMNRWWAVVNSVMNLRVP
jgi:hypothetical protein